VCTKHDRRSNAIASPCAVSGRSRRLVRALFVATAVSAIAAAESARADGPVPAKPAFAMPPNLAAPSAEVSSEIAREQPAIQKVAHLMNARQMDAAQSELSALMDRIQSRLGAKTPPNLAFQVTMAVNAARGSELAANPQVAASLYGGAGQGWLGPLASGKAMQDMVDALRLAQSDPSKAAAAMQRATAAYEPLKRMLTATEGTPEAAQTAALFRPQLDVAVATAAKAPGRPDVAAAGFAALVDVRGDRLDLERRISAGLEELPPNQNASLRAQWFAVDDKLAAIELQRANGVPLTPQDSALLAQLKAQQQALMRQLSGASQSARSKDVKPAAKDAASILQANLKPDEAVVSYALYRSGGPESAPLYSLCAFILTATALQTVDLGPAAPIDAAVASFLEAVGQKPTPLARKIEVAHLLYSLSFAPIAGKLGNAIHTIRVIPDGSLQLVPFDAFHDGTNFLIDSMRFVYATSERELLPRYWPSAAPGRPLVVGDIPYGPVANIAYAKRFAPGDFPPIDGAGAEVREVAAGLPNADVQTGTVTDAGFGSVHAPRILHIAAHGIFLPFAGAPAPSQAARGVVVAHTGPSASAVAQVAAHAGIDDAGDDPLARAALVLAQSPSTDGFLTALEVTTLDLWGTDLVVLSACDSGRGQVAAGEGVRGFRTAFESAGARALVTSLWSVDDTSTKQLMTDFYGRLTSNAGRGPALHEAMLAIRSKKTDPYYWAPFILLGEDGPLGAAPVRPATDASSRFRQGLEFRRMQAGLSTSPGSGTWSVGGQSDELVDADVRRNLGMGGNGFRIVLEGAHSELVVTVNGYRGPGSYPCQAAMVSVGDPLATDPRTPPDTSSGRASGNLVVMTDGGGHFAAHVTLSAGQSTFDLVVP